MKEPKVYFKPEEWPYIKSRDNEAVLLGGAAEGPYVESGLERVIAQKLRNAIEEAKSGEGAVVLLREFKGVGKSAAAAAAVHTLLQSGDVAAVDVDLSAGVDEQSLTNALSEARQRGRFPIAFIDANRLEFYSGAWKVRLNDLPDSLTKAVVTAKREGAVAFVIMDEIVSNFTTKKSPILARMVDGATRVDAYAFITSSKYLSVLVEKYSGCSKDVASAIGYAISTNFDDSWSLLSVLAARELRRSGCGAGAGEVLERAKRAAARYALDYLWHVLVSEDEKIAKVGTAILVLAAYFNEERLERWYMSFVEHGIPPRGVLFYALKSAMLGAFNRAYGVGEDVLCQGSDEGACKFISIAADFVREYIPWKGSIEESIGSYVRKNAEIFLLAFLFS